MTTETVLVPGDYDPESPITTTLAGAWSLNWIAGFEGNSLNKIVNGALSTTTVSLAGTIPYITPNRAYVSLTAYSFFPMIHAIDGNGNPAQIVGNITDGADPDAPTFGFYNDSGTGSDGTYDVDYRYMDA